MPHHKPGRAKGWEWSRMEGVREGLGDGLLLFDVVDEGTYLLHVFFPFRVLPNTLYVNLFAYEMVKEEAPPLGIE